MRTAPSVVLIAVLFANGLASATEFQRHLYLRSGFSAEFPGEVREIDLKPDDHARAYIAKTAIYEQSGDGYSFSVTAREYRYGMPDLQGLAQTVKTKLQCTRDIVQSVLPRSGLVILGGGCLSNNSRAFARLLARGRWFYQALAVVPESRRVDGSQFVSGLQLMPPRNGHAETRTFKSSGTSRKPIRKSKLKLRVKRKSLPMHASRPHARPKATGSGNADYGSDRQQNAFQNRWWINTSNKRR